MIDPFRDPPPVERIGAIAVRRFGAGKPLVLLHGGVGSWMHWVANIESLAQSFEVIAVDMPGYGSAGAAPDERPDSYIEQVADDLTAAAGGSRFDVAAFSFGAVVAASIARRRPDAIGKLSLLGAGGFGPPAGRNVVLKPLPDRAADETAYRRTVAYNLGQFMLSYTPSPNDPVVKMNIANIDNMRFDSRQISFVVRLLDELVQARAQLQMIWGAKDRLAHPSTIEARAALCAQTLPKVEVHIVPDAGHWVQHEATPAVNDLLIRFHR